MISGRAAAVVIVHSAIRAVAIPARMVQEGHASAPAIGRREDDCSC
jgi:hypothetical protein